MELIKKIRKKSGMTRYAAAQEVGESLNRWISLEGNTETWSIELEFRIRKFAKEHIPGFTDKDFEDLKEQEARRQRRDKKKREAEKRERKKKRLLKELEKLEEN